MLQGRPKYDQRWVDCLDRLRAQTTEDEFVRWIKPIKALGYDGAQLRLGVPNKGYADHIDSKYMEILQPVIREVYGEQTRIYYAVPAAKTTAADTTISSSSTKSTAANSYSTPTTTADIKNPFVIPGLKRLNIDPNLNSQYTFENFIEGDCNRLSRSAGLSVANSPGNNPFNPLYIYGNSGLGKTHVVQAIGNQICETHPHLQVLYVSMNKFQAQFQIAVKNGELPDFIHFYQTVDVLIIDDIQELTGNKAGTQNAFFNIFNHLQLLGKQIVLTSDKSPVELKDLEERLLTRFKWGFASQLEPPGYDTKVKIIESKAKMLGTTLPADVVDYLANNIMSNVREIEGALSAIVANAKFLGRRITVSLAREILKSYVKFNNREINIDQIIGAVCDHFSITPEALNSKRRTADVAQARQIVMYLAKQHTKMALSSIGLAVGGRNHSTVLYSFKAVSNLMETDKQMKAVIEKLTKEIFL
ncbi:MAG: chromosomal replication initiator protein DnaA [Rikenellaceae bacterium]